MGAEQEWGIRVKVEERVEEDEEGEVEKGVMEEKDGVRVEEMGA